MLLSSACKLPLGLLSICVLGSDARPSRLLKRDNNINVLNGANFPDPSIIDYNGVSYVFGTVDGAGHNVPLTSNANFDDASSWSAITDAFPCANVPAFGSGGWAQANTTWAPDVNQLVSPARCTAGGFDH
jgi:hypothetical protein